MKTKSDNQLVGAWQQNGCNSSVNELWNRYNRLGSSVARSILRSHTGSHDDVFDVNHDSFLDSLHKFDSARYLGPQDSAFKNYYLRLVKNRAISVWRKRKNMPQMESFEIEGVGETLSNNLYRNLMMKNELQTLCQFVKNNYLQSDSLLLLDWLEAKRIGLRPQWNELAKLHPVSIDKKLAFKTDDLVAQNEGDTLDLLVKTMDLCPEITVELQICPTSNVTHNQQRAIAVMTIANQRLKKRFVSNGLSGKQSRLSATIASNKRMDEITIVVTKGAYRCADALRMRLNAIIKNYRKNYHHNS